METRICKIEKPRNTFPGSRWQCKDCQNAKKRENRLKKLQEKPSEDKMKKTLKTCICCTKVKKLIDFRIDSNQCKECFKEKRRLAREKKKQENLKNSSTEKTCIHCKETKKLIDFSSEGNKCKQCLSKIGQKNKDKVIKREEELKLQTKTCRHCNVEQDISKFRKGEYTCWDCQKYLLYKWRKENPDKVYEIEKRKRQKPNYSKNNAKLKRDRYNNDIQEKLRMNYRQKLRGYIFKGYKNKDFKELFGCSRKMFLHWIESNMLKDMNWSNYGKKWNLDHTKPCSSFDLTDQEQLKKCFSWKNTMPMFVSDNLKKYINIDEDLLTIQEARVNIFKIKYKKFLKHTEPEYLKQKTTLENL